MRPKIHVIITTYRRKEKLLLLLSDISNESDAFDISVSIFDDGTPLHESATYDLLRAAYPDLDMSVFRFERNGGKQRYWSLVNKAFKEAQTRNYSYIAMMPDDVRLCTDYFLNCLYYWTNIEDPAKVCLNPLVIDGKAGIMQWVSVKPRIVVYGGMYVWRTQWNDLMLFSDGRFLDALEYRIDRIPPARWRRHSTKHLSSGVGQQISLRLHGKGYSLYQTPHTLASHGSHESMMNADIRSSIHMIATI